MLSTSDGNSRQHIWYMVIPSAHKSKDGPLDFSSGGRYIKVPWLSVSDFIISFFIADIPKSVILAVRLVVKSMF